MVRESRKWRGETWEKVDGKYNIKVERESGQRKYNIKVETGNREKVMRENGERGEKAERK